MLQSGTSKTPLTPAECVSLIGMTLQPLFVTLRDPVSATPH